MEKLLTVIVPTYNVEKYIEKNLSSFEVMEVLEQLEILVVNDGSTDGSVAIAEQFVRMHPESFRIIHKENGGHGSTINCGIKEAKGKYIKVVDADDWVTSDGLIHLMECLGRTDSDVVVSNFYWYDHQTGRLSVEIDKPFSDVIYGKEYIFSDVCGDMYIKMHAMTIKADILRRIPEIDEHCFYVDAEYVLFPIPYVNTVTCIEDFVYMYRIGLPGQSMDITRMQRNEENFDRVLSRVLSYYEDCRKGNTEEAKILYMEKFIARLVASRYKIFLSYPYSGEIKEKMASFDHNIKAKYPEIYTQIQNRFVKILQMSKFSLYRLAQFVYKKKEGIK